MIPRAQKYGYDHFDSASSPGDLNEDGVVDVLDIVLLVGIILAAKSQLVAASADAPVADGRGIRD